MLTDRVEIKSGQRIADKLIDEAKSEGRSPYSVLLDILGEYGTNTLGEGLAKWIYQNGPPTFEKLHTFFAGYDDGVSAAVCALSQTPSAHKVEDGDHYGVIVLRHNQTMETYVVPYTTSTMAAAVQVAKRIRDRVDPRRGMWTAGPRRVSGHDHSA